MGRGDFGSGCGVLTEQSADFVWQSPDFELGADPFATVRGIQGEIFRDVAGRVTLRFERSGRAYFLKHHRGVGWVEILKNLLFLRLPILGADNEWRAIHCLEGCGVPTMTLVAYGRRGINPARRESFIITEALAPTLSLEELIDTPEHKPLPTKLKRQLIAEVARMTAAMHRAGMNHRDLYLCHFLLHTDLLAKGQIRLSLIDLHRAQLRDRVPRRWWRKDLASLCFSSIPGQLTYRDELRFLRCYFDKPLRQTLETNAKDLVWLRSEAARLRRKYLRKYAPDSQ